MLGAAERVAGAVRAKPERTLKKERAGEGATNWLIRNWIFRVIGSGRGLRA